MLRKIPARTAWNALLLFAAFPFVLRGQTASAASEAKSPASLQTIARDLTQELSHKKLKVVVLDFSGPDAKSSAFGAYLAEEFVAVLAKDPGTLTLIDRSQLPAALEALRLKPADAANYLNYKAISKKLGAQCVIAGSFGEFKGGLGITLDTECPHAFHTSPAPIYRRIEFSPEMATHLGAPLDSLRSNDGAPNAGTGGFSYPSCLSCPEAAYTEEAVAARLEGTVALIVVVTPEGRATDIQVTHGLDHGLTQTAIAAVEGWTFNPARDPEGNPASVRQTIEVAFRFSH
jgi:TonB family protein